MALQVRVIFVQTQSAKPKKNDALPGFDDREMIQRFHGDSPLLGVFLSAKKNMKDVVFFWGGQVKSLCVHFFCPSFGGYRILTQSLSFVI